MTGVRSLRGDVNAILNSLIREGVITAFETNFDNPTSIAFALHVRVTADVVTDPRRPGFDRKRFDGLRERIRRELDPLSPGVVVSVRHTPSETLAPARQAPLGVRCRDARRLLGWSIEALAHTSGVSKEAINRLELGRSVPRPDTLAAIVGTFERAGVEFTEDGVRLRPEALNRKRS